MLTTPKLDKERLHSVVVSTVLMSGALHEYVSACAGV